MKELFILIFLAADPGVSQKLISLTELKEHKQGADCWIAIEGKVYDVTQYISKHPKKGRDALIDACGTEATQEWKAKGPKKTPHSSKAQAQLIKMEIGTLIP